MPSIALTTKAGASFGNTGKMFYFPPPVTEQGALTSADFKELGYPGEVFATNTRASMAIYNGSGVSRAYFVGSATENMLFSEDFGWVVQGILPISNEIVGVTGTGTNIGVVIDGTATGITGELIVYFSKWDDIHGRRSALSMAAPTITMTDDGVTISNLPTTDKDPTVTHIEIWHSVNGSTPQLAMRVQLGVTTITEGVATLSLGEVFLATFSRFPRCRYNAIYHERQVMAGDPRHPDRLYLSDLTFPERYGGLFLRTRQGEPIVAIGEVRDVLLVFGPRSTYVVQGYTEDDLEMQVLEPQIGCINHFGIVSVHGLLIIPSHLGFYISTGSSFHFIAKEYQQLWRDEYAANEISYQTDSWARDNPERNVYQFWVETPYSEITEVLSLTLSGSRHAYWTLDYTPLLQELGGSFQQPNLSFDVRARRDRSSAMLTRPGSGRGDLYVGSCDGKIRKENVADGVGSDDDDGDVFEKTLHIRTSHFLWEPGGGEDDGWKVTNFWGFVVSENVSQTVDGFFGDQDAWRHVQDLPANEDKAGDVSWVHLAGEKTFVNDNNDTETFDRKSTYYATPNFSGEGVSWAWTIRKPTKEVNWMGFGGLRIPGSSYRAAVAIAQGE